MARPKRERRTCRLNLELDEEIRSRLDEMQEETKADSLTEVIRRALSLLDMALKERREGGEVIFRGRDGKERTLLVT